MPILLSKTADNPVPDSPGKWRAGEVVAAVADDHVFGAQEVPEAGHFHHITITDKTLEEVQSYLQAWSHNPTTVQLSAVGNDRVIEVTSDMVAVGGANAFTQEGFTQMLADINAEYPTANAAYQSHTNTTYVFTITAPVAARDEIIERVNEAVRNMQYRRRRWYITAAGRTFLDGNGGVVSGTAAQVAQYLRDGLLD